MIRTALTAVGLLAVVLVYALMRWSARRARGGIPHEDPVRPNGPIASFAAQDWLVAAYMLVFWVLVALGTGPRRPALVWISLDVVAFFGALVIARAPTTPRLIADVVYRIALPGAIASTFSQLHVLLPSVRAATYDGALYRFDKAVFGFEPAEAWDPYVSPGTTEWFSFYYYLYFAILLVHVLPMAIVERRMHVLREFSWGIFFVFCAGHLIYLGVPGYGPYRHLGATFTHALDGPTFWPLVSRTVASFDGAHRTDIFPSLHTAAPTFLTLFSYRHRRELPFRYTWPVLAFVTANIIVATMFLRWHYLIDVCAGLALATTAFAGACRIPAADDAARARGGLPPIWRPLVDRRSRRDTPEPAARRRR
ncbi:MAG TPA: phosphatase PAP2 family protein [Polyangiaceae bacterium]|nr:phosphatase PAP2 family protein [Polyangiaceae bacterium]